MPYAEVSTDYENIVSETRGNRMYRRAAGTARPSRPFARCDEDNEHVAKQEIYPLQLKCHHNNFFKFLKKGLTQLHSDARGPGNANAPAARRPLRPLQIVLYSS
jgi:hypothetical protein